MVSHREVAERWLANPPHGSFTPTVVLTEPSPLLEPYDELTSEELWLDGSTIIIPTVMAISGATRYSQQVISHTKGAVAYHTVIARAFAHHRN